MSAAENKVTKIISNSHTMATGRSTGKGKTVRYVDQSNSKGIPLQPQPPITKNVSISSFYYKLCEWMLMLYEQKETNKQTTTTTKLLS